MFTLFSASRWRNKYLPLRATHIRSTFTSRTYFWVHCNYRKKINREWGQWTFGSKYRRRKKMKSNLVVQLHVTFSHHKQNLFGVCLFFSEVPFHEIRLRENFRANLFRWFIFIDHIRREKSCRKTSPWHRLEKCSTISWRSEIFQVHTPTSVPKYMPRQTTNYSLNKPRLGCNLCRFKISWTSAFETVQFLVV